MFKKLNSKSLNLWIINQFANTPDMPGGSRHYELAEYFVKQNLKVNIFSSDFNLATRSFLKLNDNEYFKKEKIRNIEWNWLRVFPYKKNNWQRYLNLISFCFNLLIVNSFLGLNKNLPDVIIASSPQLIAAFQSLIFAKIFGKKFIFEVRDIWPQILIELGGSNPRSLFIKILQFLEFILYKYSDLVVVLAKGAKSYVIKNGASNVVWLPNGPNLKQFTFSDLPDEPKSFTYKRPFRIIYAGAHGLANDLNNVIEAAKLLVNDPVKIILIGDGPEKDKLMNKAKDIKNIIFQNPLAKSEISYEMMKADAILISLKDVDLFKFGISPNKLYDAYALGRPVISSVGGFVNQEIEENNLGLVSEPGKPRDLAKIIKKMYQLPRIKREAMGKNGRQIAENIYSREKVRLQYLNLIKKYS